MSRLKNILNDRWLGSLSLVAAGVFMVVINRSGGGGWTSTFVVLALLLVVAWWSFPARRGPHQSHAEAQATAEDDDVIVYWRPG